MEGPVYVGRRFVGGRKLMMMVMGPKLPMVTGAVCH